MPNGGTAFLKDSSDGTTNVGDLNNPQNQYKSFLHIPIWKCANNDVRENLNKTIPHSTQVKFLSHGKLESWLKYIGGSKNVRHSCIVVVVRDPISHFLSGYNEYECRLNNEIGTELKKKQKWVGNPVNFERFVFGTEARFEQFVVDFLNGPNRDQLFDYWSNLYHMYSLTGVLTKLNKLYRRKLTGYLPSVNDLENNYPSFLNETCPGVLPKSAYEPWRKEDRVFHESEADELGFRSAANAVWGNGGRTARALCLIHTIDYACYDKIPVPVFCRDVYLSEPFSNGLNRTNIKRKATPI